MNQLDIFLGGAVLLFGLSGLFGGAVRRVVQVAALIIAFREAWRLTPYIESFFGSSPEAPYSGWGFIVPLLSFGIVYIVVRLVGGWFGSLAKGPFLGLLDRLIGLALGLLVGVYLLGYGCLLFEGIFPTPPYSSESQEAPSARQSSVVYPLLMESVSHIRPYYHQVFGTDSTETPSTPPNR